MSRLRIILDESLTKQADLKPLMSDPDRWIANIRVSKVGGILRAVALANRSADAGIGVILGSHVGETSLLTRASIVVANCLKQPLFRWKALLEHGS
jgi:L-alanine-DL-glutamate epimerase-like enolase superfamily enzyme